MNEMSGSRGDGDDDLTGYGIYLLAFRLAFFFTATAEADFFLPLPPNAFSQPAA